MKNKKIISAIAVAFLVAGCSTTNTNLPLKVNLPKVQKTDKIYQKYGKMASLREKSLKQLMQILSSKSEQEKIKKVNDFFNQFIFTTDEKMWNKSDYWATRSEFLGKGGGDCEDFVIAKYFTLKELGVSTDKLYFTYVRALKLNQAHMVLSYFKTPYSMPLVLDNIQKDILPANLRNDLAPVYSFNGEKLFIANKSGLGKEVSISSEKRANWVDLNLRIQMENK
ncbi:MAG: transglutaminase [Proteobacteria bacterium]|nr:MAG: transglutaminase [Pseudomonadota bacterium]